MLDLSTQHLVSLTRLTLARVLWAVSYSHDAVEDTETQLVLGRPGMGTKDYPASLLLGAKDS